MIKNIINILFFCGLGFSSFGQQEWIQRGDQFDGTITNEGLGEAVAISSDGNSIAFSSCCSTDTNTLSYVSVYDWDASTLSWIQRGENFANETQEWWSSIDIHDGGNSVVVGSTWSATDSINLRKGIVKVYDWDALNEAWIQRGQEITGDDTYDKFGHSVAIGSDGNTIIAGTFDDPYSGHDKGYAKVFFWNGLNWTQKGSVLTGASNLDYFGSSVDISNASSTIAIGAIQKAGGSNLGPGYVVVYDWNVNDWTQRGDTILGDSRNHLFGSSMAMNHAGNTLIIGDMHWDPLGDFTKNGSAIVYKWDGTEWTQKGDMFTGEPADELGTSVSINDEGNIVGIGYSTLLGSNNNTVKVYSWNGSVWTQMGSTIEPNMGVEIGDAIALDSLGNTLVASGKLGTGAFYSGNLTVYDYKETAGLEGPYATLFSSIYPNPTKGLVKIVLTEPLEFDLAIISANGQEIMERHVTKTNNYEFLLTPPIGVYIVSIKSSKGVNYFRIVKD